MTRNQVFSVVILLFVTQSLIHGGVWQREVPDSSSNSTGWFNSLAIDSDNNPQIAYYADDIYDLRYAHYRNGSWTLKLSTVLELWDPTAVSLWMTMIVPTSPIRKGTAFSGSPMWD